MGDSHSKSTGAAILFLVLVVCMLYLADLLIDRGWFRYFAILFGVMCALWVLFGGKKEDKNDVIASSTEPPAEHDTSTSLGAEDQTCEIVSELISNIKSDLSKKERWLESYITYLDSYRRADWDADLDEHESKLRGYQGSELLANTPLAKDLEQCLEHLQRVKELIESYNQRFIERRRREYAHLFRNGDTALDDEQQRAILTDDMVNLVVAGAGSGKTETLITKIAYIVQRKPDGVEPGRILALAYQRKAKEEMDRRLKERYGIEVEVRTFHSLGYKILGYSDIVQGAEKTRFVRWAFEELCTQPGFQKKLIDYIRVFGNEPLTEAVESYEPSGDETYTALDGTEVKSLGELKIMNFLLTRKLNGRPIQVLYEKPAEWMPYSKGDGAVRFPKPDFLLPQYGIYIEHWALDENGRVPAWFSGGSEKYRRDMEIKKRRFEQQDDYSLVETFYYELKDGTLLSSLEERLLSELRRRFPDKEFEIDAMTSDEILKRIKKRNELVRQVHKDIKAFIENAKKHGFTPDDIERRLSSGQWSEKQRVFGAIALDVYRRYQESLSEWGKIDYEDMINRAVDALRANSEICRGAFDYILVDEYQDISQQRYLLLREILRRNHRCKLFCVGDDWQAIMEFSGARLDYFVNMQDYFGPLTRIDVTTNYRSRRTIVEAGQAVIRHNGTTQIQKTTRARDGRKASIKLFVCEHTDRKEYFWQVGFHCAELVRRYLDSGTDPSEIMILWRIRNPWIKSALVWHATSLGIQIAFDERPDDKVSCLTVHKSKGLEARVVIVLGVDDDTYGFPCKIEDPDILEPARDGHRIVKEEAERRLFYVAITRAKEELILYTHGCKPSKFLRYIERYVRRETIGIQRELIRQFRAESKYYGDSEEDADLDEVTIAELLDSATVPSERSKDDEVEGVRIEYGSVGSSTITIAGKGQQTTDPVSLRGGLMVFNLRHEGEGYFSAYLMDKSGRVVDFLGSSFGPTEHSKEVHLGVAGEYLLSIRAAGRWFIEITRADGCGSEQHAGAKKSESSDNEYRGNRLLETSSLDGCEGAEDRVVRAKSQSTEELKKKRRREEIVREALERAKEGYKEQRIDYESWGQRD